MKHGNYMIINIVNKKVYIGETLYVDRRWNEHKNDLNNKSHDNHKLQSDWNKYGENLFEFRRVEDLYCTTIINNVHQKIYCIWKENILIKQYESIAKGYNIKNTLDRIINMEIGIFNELDLEFNKMATYMFKVLDKCGKIKYDKITIFEIINILNNNFNNDGVFRKYIANSKLKSLYGYKKYDKIKIEDKTKIINRLQKNLKKKSYPSILNEAHFDKAHYKSEIKGE